MHTHPHKTRCNVRFAARAFCRARRSGCRCDGPIGACHARPLCRACRARPCLHLELCSQILSVERTERAEERSAAGGRGRAPRGPGPDRTETRSHPTRQAPHRAAACVCYAHREPHTGPTGAGSPQYGPCLHVSLAEPGAQAAARHQTRVPRGSPYPISLNQEKHARSRPQDLSGETCMHPLRARDLSWACWHRRRERR